MDYYYLAHPFTEKDRTRKWELRIEKKLGIDLRNPFFDVMKPKVKKIASSKNPYPYKNINHEPEEIVNADEIAILNSRGVIALLPYPNIGVSMEILYAREIADIPVLCVTPMIYHPWLIYYCKLFKSKKALTKWLKEHG